MSIPISIIIPSYGREACLLETVTSLLSQLKTGDEILVMHQKPNLQHPSTRLLKDWDASEKIRWFKLDFAHAQRARNLGIREARCKIFLLLDDDIQPSPKILESHRNAYLQYPELEGTVGSILDPGGSLSFHLEPHYFRPHLGWQFLPLNYGYSRWLFNWPSTNASLLKKVAIEVGSFDEQFDRTWLDDTDFSWRLKRRGTRLQLVPEAYLIHLKTPRGGARLMSRPDLWMDHDGWRIHFYFWLKNFGWLNARTHYQWMIRYLIFRKDVLLRPTWLIRNLSHLIRGIFAARNMLTSSID